MSDNATLEDFGLNLDHENIFGQDDLLSTWIEAENNAVFCQSFQNFWGDSVGFDMSSSTFLSQSTLPQALLEDLSVTKNTKIRGIISATGLRTYGILPSSQKTYWTEPRVALSLLLKDYSPPHCPLHLFLSEIMTILSVPHFCQSETSRDQRYLGKVR